MIYYKTKLKSIFLNMEDEVPELIRESFMYLDGLLKLDNILVTEEQYVKLHGDISDFDYLQLDELEEFLELPTPDKLDRFEKGNCSKQRVVNRRVKDFLDFYERVKVQASDATTAYVPLVPNEVHEIKANVKEALGHLATFIYYQYGMDLVTNCLVNNSEVQIDIDFFNYAESNNADPQALILQVKRVMETYRPSLPIFDDKPELEEPFYDVAGPYVHDFDSLESVLTLDDVLTVINNPTLDVEKYIKELEKNAGDTSEPI